MDILTGAGEIVTASPHENADLFRAFPNSYGTLGYAVRLRIELEPVAALRRAHASAVPRHRRARRRDGPHHQDRSARREAGRLPRRRRVQRRRELPLRRRPDRGIRTRQRLHRPADLLPLDPARRGCEDRPAQHPRLSLAMGCRLVLVFRGVRGAASGDPSILAAAVPAQPFVRDAHAAGTAVRHRRSPREAARPTAARAGDPGHRGADREVRRVRATGSSRTCRSSRSGCARSGCATTRAGRCIRSARARRT